MQPTTLKPEDVEKRVQGIIHSLSEEGFADIPAEIKPRELLEQFARDYLAAVEQQKELIENIADQTPAQAGRIANADRIVDAFIQGGLAIAAAAKKSHLLDVYVESARMDLERESSETAERINKLFPIPTPEVQVTEPHRRMRGLFSGLANH